MKGKYQSDLKNRKLYKKYEKKKILLKSIFYNESIPYEVREKSYQKLQKISRKSSISRLKHRCVLTGRPRSVYSDFNISRIQLRELALLGLIPNIYKASW